MRSELAVAHLAFGVLDLPSTRFRGMFSFATVVGPTREILAAILLSRDRAYKITEARAP